MLNKFSLLNEIFSYCIYGKRLDQSYLFALINDFLSIKLNDTAIAILI